MVDEYQPPRRWVSVIILGGALVVIWVVTAVLWLDGARGWWVEEVVGEGGAPSRWVPGPINDLANFRTRWGDVHVHVLMWIVPGFLVSLVARRQRWRLVLVGSVMAWSVVVEVVQPVFAESRRAVLGEAVANVVGVAIGAAIGWWWIRRRRSATASAGTDGRCAQGGVEPPTERASA